MKASPILTPVRDCEERFGLRDCKAQWLLAENMFPGLGGPNGPRDMKLIGKRIVDSVDIGVGEKFFVRAVGRGNAEGRRGFLSFRKIAGCDGDNTGVLSLLHGRDHLLETDGGGAENSPAELVGHGGHDKGKECLGARFFNKSDRERLDCRR
jgi:hypothetical protein